MSMIEISYFDQCNKLCHTDTAAHDWKRVDDTYVNDNLGFAFQLKVSEYVDGISWSVPVSSFAENKDNRLASLTFCTGLIKTEQSGEVQFILPCDIGVSCYCCGKDPAEYFLPGFSSSKWPEYVMNMLMTAMLSPEGSRIMIIDDCRFDSGFRLRTNYGIEHTYSIDPIFNLRRNRNDNLSDESPSLLCRNISGGLSDVAQYYRNYLCKRFGITTLAEKFAASEKLKESAESLMIRMRMATKPVPSPVKEQTFDNQPEVCVLMDFDAAIKVADECARQHIPHIDFTFVGWNYGGHDGAFPQIFPVEENIGGEAGMIKAIDRMKGLGYKVGIHDNFYDSYTLANNLDRSDWAIDDDGNIHKGEIWGGGQAYLLCPERALERYAPEHFADLEKFGLDGAYYVDVISLCNLYSCSNPEHPLSFKESAECFKKILLEQRKFSGVAMSEGAREWALPEVDRAYAATNRPDSHTGLPFADETVPLFSMIFHGLVLYNSCRMTINAMPGEDYYLDNIRFGGLPLLYFYQRFQVSNTSILNSACDDLRVTTDEKLREDVAKIKQISDDVKRLASLQSVFITDYETLENGLILIRYENGSEMYVNYDNEPQNTPEGEKVPAKDFKIINVKE
ncbi:MAG: hypothetical protein JXR78_13670 [Victivallales bacterium]|nr:hypothetical protein [Victivallales bacterium]